jgi:hypothetical protein
MSISRVKPNWGVGEKLTSAQQNQLDTNVTYALDKRSGETDTLESVVQLDTGGRIVKEQVLGADVDTTYDVTDGGFIWVHEAVVSSPEYTLDDANAEWGDEITIAAHPSASTVTIKNHDGNELFTLGFGDECDGPSAVFRFDSIDWTVILGHPSREIVEEFTSSDTWTCPRGVTKVRIEGVGGGGGGGGGAGGANGTALDAGISGGGGAGARLGTAWIDVTPGDTYTITIGTGGAGGLAGAANTDGADGSDGTSTTFEDGVPTVLASFLGAGGGARGESGETVNTFSQGGLVTAYGSFTRPLVLPANVVRPVGGHEGGAGTNYSPTAGTVAAMSRYGGGSPVAAGAAHGASGGAGTGAGKGGGGGGASGWHGSAAGAGGAGGSPGVAGTAGTLGAGGGGGGSGGSLAAGANGGAGGNGALRIIYVK